MRDKRYIDYYTYRYYMWYRRQKPKDIILHGLIVLGCMAIFLAIVYFTFENDGRGSKSFSDLTQSFEYVMEDSRKNDEVVTNFSIIIDGNFNGQALFEIEDGLGGCVTLNLSGKIKEKYYSIKWHQKKITAKFTPISIADGSRMLIRYKFS